MGAGAYRFPGRECPETASPSLWRQSRLVAQYGLYEVEESIYQVRGFDLPNVTLVEGDRGVFVIDPLISAETAAAALALYRRHRSERPVIALLYTHSHSHIDHFGGARGVLSQEDVDAGVPGRQHVRRGAAQGGARADRCWPRPDNVHRCYRSDPAHGCTSLVPGRARP